MNVRHATLLLGLLAAAVEACAQPVDHERNWWPIEVRNVGPTVGGDSWTGAGPFLFRRPQADDEGNTASGFRPIWVQLNTPQDQLRAGYFLYPIFSYSATDTYRRWSLFELIRFSSRRPTAPAPESNLDQRKDFEIFPVWFSREAADPAESYRGLMPIYGTLRNRFGFDRMSWTLCPLYVETEKRGAVTTSTPWPIIRVTRGAGHGWGIWPLFNYVDRPGVSRHETYLWPLGYNSIRYPWPDDPPGTPPRRDIGFLPFFGRSTGPGYVYADFLWPLFGYTERTAPYNYIERRFLWPLFVQGRGENRYLNRWAPFYTHSIYKGYNKHWFAWPLFRHGEWIEHDIVRTRSQLLYFVYWREEQRPVGREQAAPASLTQVWPLFNNWNNGAGRRQWQLFSPLNAFFPGNDKIRLIWAPLFAIVRHDQRAPGDTRTSLFWNAFTWERKVSEERSEWHLGPLLGATREGSSARVAIGNGLFGFRREAGTGWRMFWLDFQAKPATNPAAPR